MDGIYIQDRFTIEKDGITLSDAIVLPQGEYESKSKQEIEAIKQERFDTYKDRLKNPPIVPEPSKADKLAIITKDLASLEEQKQTLLSMKQSLEGK